MNRTEGTDSGARKRSQSNVVNIQPDRSKRTDSPSELGEPRQSSVWQLESAQLEGIVADKEFLAHHKVDEIFDFRDFDRASRALRVADKEVRDPGESLRLAVKKYQKMAYEEDRQ